MKTQRKHGFTIVELVVVIAVIAILAAVLIPTFVSIIKKANNSAYLQERTSQQIADLAEKVENQNYLTWEDFEAVLARELAKVGSKSTEDIQNAIKVALAEHAVSDSGLSEAQVQKIINEAMSGQLTTAQVQAIVEQSIKNAGISVGTSGGVTAAQVQSIVSAAIANIPTQTGVTPAMVQSAVASALENAQVTGVSEADIKKALEAFGVSTLTEQQIVEIVNQIATDVSGKTGNEQIVATLNIRAAGNGKATLYDTFVAMSISDPTTAVKSITAEETILWDSEDKKFVLDSDGSHTGARYWTVSDSISDKWSTYYTGTESTISTTKGFDAGTTTSVTSVTYSNTGSAQNVVIRTNGGTLTIDAENDTVMHYGEAQVVTLTAVSTSSYYEHGSVNLVDIKKGRLVITNEAGAEVGTIYLTATNDAYDGIILATQSGSELPDVVAREAVSNPTTGEKLVVTIQTNVDANGENPAKTEEIYLYPASDVKEATNGYNVSDLGLLVVEAISSEAQTQAAGQIADAAVLESVKESNVSTKEEVTAAATMFAGGKGTESNPYLIATAQHWNNIYVSLHEQAISETPQKLYFKLINDIDFTEIALDTIHISNDKVSFNLDGNNYKISGINKFTAEHYLFFKIRNTEIENITISYNGANDWMGLSYSSYGGVTRITNVVTEGTIYATGGWLCSFIEYPYGTMDATGEDAYVYYKNCVNKTDHLGNAEYAAPFGAHVMTVKQISFENCSNTGTIAGQHASGFIGMTGGRTTQFEFVGENPAVNRGTIKTTSSNIGNARNFSTDEKKSGDNYKVTVSGTDYIVNVSGATLSSVATLNVTVASEMNGDITISNIADAEYYYVELTITRQGYNFNDSNLKNVWGGSLGAAELDFVVGKSNSDKTKLPFGKVYVCESDKDRVDWRNRDSVVDYKGLYYLGFNPEHGEVVVADDYKEIICYQYDSKTFLYIDDYNTVGALTQANQNGTNLNLTVSFAVYAYDANDILVGQKTVSYTININDAYNFFNGVENHFAN